MLRLRALTIWNEGSAEVLETEGVVRACDSPLRRVPAPMPPCQGQRRGCNRKPTKITHEDPDSPWAAEPDKGQKHGTFMLIITRINPLILRVSMPQVHMNRICFNSLTVQILFGCFDPALIFLSFSLSVALSLSLSLSVSICPSVSLPLSLSLSLSQSRAIQGV